MYTKRNHKQIYENPLVEKEKRKRKKKNLDSSERNETLSKGEKAIQTTEDFPPETTEARSSDTAFLKC